MPDEIVMHLELLDMGFDVNPWVKKRSFTREELANCADDRAFFADDPFEDISACEIFSLFDNFDFR